MDWDDACAALRPSSAHRRAAARIAHERRKQGLRGLRGGGVRIERTLGGRQCVIEIRNLARSV